MQTREADRAFLVKGFGSWQFTFTLCIIILRADKQLIKQLKASSGFLQVSPSPFLERFVSQTNGVVKGVYAMLMTIPKMFDFHTKLKHDFVIDLYVIKKMKR